MVKQVAKKVAASTDTVQPDIELQKLALERARYRMDIVKWIVIAIGAAVSFAVLDVGKLWLEQYRATSNHQRILLNSYLTATEAPQPEVWKRKLKLIINSATDKRTVAWANKELAYINEFAELDTLYRETLKVASQLVGRSSLANPARSDARSRFEQLYWADLPFAGEGQDVINAMIGFRRQLRIAEADAAPTAEWDKLNGRLHDLSEALKKESEARRAALEK